MTVDQAHRRTTEHPLLGGRPHDVALTTADAEVTYADLAERVNRRAAELGVVRRLVLLEAGNDVESVVTYLAALSGRHPVLLAAPGDVDRHADLVRAYRPDVVHRAGEALRELRPGGAHDLHDDLAVLLSTSGSTGSPKLVRLSLANVVANARSIAAYLGIRATDDSRTGHHLAADALLLRALGPQQPPGRRCGGACSPTSPSPTSASGRSLPRPGSPASPVSPTPSSCWRHRASGTGTCPPLRYLTQAGGRMDPAHVREWADPRVRNAASTCSSCTARRRPPPGWPTCPPIWRSHRPDAVGIPIPGGRFRLAGGGPGGEPVHVGELVYSGPNVMMGYAESPADLARGAELAELRTGDLARQADDGLWEIVGRLDRHAKLFGLRLDLDRIENLLVEHDRPARVLVRDEHLWVFTDRPRSVDRTLRAVLDVTGLPASAVRVVRLDALPRSSSGKPDYNALATHADTVAAGETSADHPEDATAHGIRDLYAVLLGRPDATVHDSFVDLGGDSLSYVEASTRLGHALGALPPNWQRLAPEALARTRRNRRRWTVPVDLSVVLRAVAVVLILVSHADLAQVQGGAHVLLALAGYNLARFQLAVPDRVARVRGILRSAASVAVPAALWIGAATVATGDYRWQTAVFLNGFTGSPRWSDDWQFWFLVRWRTA